MGKPILQLEGVHKRFGPVHALRGVQLTIFAGEVHALIGENGAGKSTLMKILSGAHQPTEGRLALNGEDYAPGCPQEGRRAGIAMIYQELTLAPHLSIEDNILLGVEQSHYGLNKKKTEKIEAALALLGRADLKPNTLVGSLKIGTQQLVEIARAIVSEAKIIIMDEPTSSLSTEDTRTLFAVIRKLKDQGIAIIYISHFLEEVREISDRYTILRDGQTCGAGRIDSVSIEEIIERMIGRDLEEMYPRLPHEIGAPILRCSHISGVEFPKGVSFQLHEGEILGIFGLIGAGRSELLRVLFGLDPMVDGKVGIQDSLDLGHQRRTPKRSLRAGLDYLSEDRKSEGLAQRMSIVENTTLSALQKETKYGVIDLKKEKSTADKWASELGLKCHSTTDPIRTLSGGNQQKVAIARLMNHDSQVFFLDEPTRGIDVGSKVEIYRLIQQLASKGKSVILVSSYLPELQGVCDTLAVMYRGNLSPIQSVKEWSTHEVMSYATRGMKSK
ncbi:MAG: sugar ABC transporter ATP-binding protein [Coraliomargaritaceae bacterium]